jgi:hypothetical protein
MRFLKRLFGASTATFHDAARNGDSDRVRAFLHTELARALGEEDGRLTTLPYAPANRIEIAKVLRLSGAAYESSAPA